MKSTFHDDAELAIRIRQRDPDALRQVVEAYLQQILRTARSAGLPADRAEEIAQATFVTFLESAERFQGRSKVRTWLFGILYNKISEARRGLAKSSRVDDIDQVMESRFREDGSWSRPPRSAEASLQNKELGDLISACLDEVPDRQRMAFLLREVERLSTDEICKILEVTATNLGVIFYRARNRLRECLEERGVEG